MGPPLSDRDRERFAALRERLEGVTPAELPRGSREASPGPLDPMLATTFEGDLDAVDASRFVAERKLDGTRLLLESFDGSVTCYTRRHVERSGTLPKLVEAAAGLLPDGSILDGEYTFLTPDGTSHFAPIHAGPETLAERDLEGTYVAFDVLAADGEWCLREPLERRRERLEALVPTELSAERPAAAIAVDAVREAGFRAYFDALVAAGEEGVMLKRRGSPYHLGTRSAGWQKVKATTEADVVVVGVTPGRGRRAATFGALVVTDGERYLGRVGSGFGDDELSAIAADLTPRSARPVPAAEVGRPYTPVEPFVVEVTYQSVTPSGHLRAPVFRRRRPDKPVADVTPIEPAA